MLGVLRVVSLLLGWWCYIAMHGHPHSNREVVMGEAAVLAVEPQKSEFMEKVQDLLPEGGNLNMCLTCGACSSGCPATGLKT